MLSAQIEAIMENHVETMMNTIHARQLNAVPLTQASEVISDPPIPFTFRRVSLRLAVVIDVIFGHRLRFRFALDFRYRCSIELAFFP